jgi:hypothetical protein
VSVTRSRELAQREIRIESGELTEDPEGEGDELKLIYEAKGLSPSEARSASSASVPRSRSSRGRQRGDPVAASSC